MGIDHIKQTEAVYHTQHTVVFHYTGNTQAVNHLEHSTSVDTEYTGSLNHIKYTADVDP